MLMFCEECNTSCHSECASSCSGCTGACKNTCKNECVSCSDKCSDCTGTCHDTCSVTCASTERDEASTSLKDVLYSKQEEVKKSIDTKDNAEQDVDKGFFNEEGYNSARDRKTVLLNEKRRKWGTKNVNRNQNT